MKKILLLITSLLCISLLILCGLIFVKYNTKSNNSKTENSTLQSNITSLNKQLEEKEDFINGQKEYIAELNQQLSECQDALNSNENKYIPKNNSNYQKNYPSLYAGSTYSDNETPSRTVYLTFDDGPSDLTPEVLDLLDEYNAKATFFVVYTDNPKYTSYLKEITERGHTLALHSSSHNYEKIYSSVDAFLKDFEQVYNWVYEETGQRATLFRFPGGSTNGNASVVNDIIAEMTRRGFIYYDWNVSSGDGSNLTTAENILENVTTNIGNFDCPVVLLHDATGKVATMNALPELLDVLAEEGYQLDSLNEFMVPIQYKH